MKIQLHKKIKNSNQLCLLFVRAGENFDCSNTCKP